MPYQGLNIIDFHAHFPVAGLTGGGKELHPKAAAYNRERTARMNREWDFPSPAEPYAKTDEEIRAVADRWVAELDRYGIDRICFLTGRDNETLSQVVRMHPTRFLGMAHHRITEPGAAEKLRRGVEELGLIGYKQLGPLVDVPWESEELDPVWRYCAERKLPVLIHFGVLGRAGGVVYARNMSPLTLYPVAARYPDIPFIIPHFGCGYMEDLMQLCWSCPNVYVDTSGSNQWMRWLPYPMDLEIAFRKYYELLGPERIIFGTDSSWFPRGFAYRYLQDQTRACFYLNFPEDDIQLIFGGNARRLLQEAGFVT